jgi:hypothetical protein
MYPEGRDAPADPLLIDQAHQLAPRRFTQAPCRAVFGPLLGSACELDKLCSPIQGQETYRPRRLFTFPCPQVGEAQQPQPQRPQHNQHAWSSSHFRPSYQVSRIVPPARLSPNSAMPDNHCIVKYVARQAKSPRGTLDSSSLRWSVLARQGAADLPPSTARTQNPQP